MGVFERRWANGCRVLLAAWESHAGLFGSARGAVFGAVLDEERLLFTAACIALKRTSTERAAEKNEEGRMKNAEMAGARAEGRKRGRFEVIPHPLSPVSWNVGNGAR